MTGSTFLNQIGLGGFDLGYLLIGMTVTILLLLIFLILLIVQIRKTSKLKKRLDKFLTGKDGTSLEQDIAGLYEDNKFLKANTEKNKKDIRTLYKNMESAYQKMGLVKYDAFNQMGGQLSFSLALLDENNNGAMLAGTRKTINNASYWFEASGAMQTGWILKPEGWYYANTSGAIVNGWQLIGGCWYYLEGNNVTYPGLMIANQRYTINGASYSFQV